MRVAARVPEADVLVEVAADDRDAEAVVRRDVEDRRARHQRLLAWNRRGVREPVEDI